MSRNKGTKGITLIVLIITVIMMLILLSISTYTGIDSYTKAQRKKFTLQMQLIQKKVDIICEEYKGDKLTTYLEELGVKNEEPDFPDESEIQKIMSSEEYTDYLNDPSNTIYFSRRRLNTIRN